MHVRTQFLRDATAGAGGAAPVPAAAATPAAPAAADPGTASPSAAGAQPAPSAGSPASGSLLARGAGSTGDQSGAPTADAGTGEQPAAIPEKYLVKKADGSVDHEATALKVSQGYAALAKRMGAGDAPPAKPEDYAPAVPAGMSLDALKADPLYSGFLKGAHSRGMTNAQVSYVLESMAQRMAPNPAAAEAALREAWPDDASLDAGLAKAHRAVKTYGGELMDKLDAKFGSDPDFIRLMAKIGGELGEDPGVNTGITAAEQDTLESLISHPSYLDAKHPEHSRTVAKANQLYAKKFAGK